MLQQPHLDEVKVDVLARQVRNRQHCLDAHLRLLPLAAPHTAQSGSSGVSVLLHAAPVATASCRGAVRDHQPVINTAASLPKEVQSAFGSLSGSSSLSALAVKSRPRTEGSTLTPHRTIECQQNSHIRGQRRTATQVRTRRSRSQGTHASEKAAIGQVASSQRSLTSWRRAWSCRCGRGAPGRRR